MKSLASLGTPFALTRGVASETIHITFCTRWILSSIIMNSDIIEGYAILVWRLQPFTFLSLWAGEEDQRVVPAPK
jgi:hypothetical protein